jgi:hypothetical protein
MTGRNDPCPCGSGKKYKHCYLGKEDDKTRSGPAQAIADAIAEAAAEQPFSSLEELNAFTAQVMDQQNQWALAEFCGLSPEQMSGLLYAPFNSPETVRFSTDVEPAQDAGIRSEEDLEELHCTRLVAELAGLIRKYRGKYVLTRKCREMLVRQDSGCLYFELFKAYTAKFNWGFRDGHPEAEIVQHSFLYTLFLLASFGEIPRSQQFYEDKFLAAFPMALEMFPETTYSTVEDDTRRCYFLRALERFAAFFGLAELTLESQEWYRYRYLTRKSAQLDRFVTFKL